MLDVPSYILGKKSGGEGGTSNYNQLSNKPSINDVTLTGNKTTADLGITIPTKTSDLTNDGDGSGLFSLTNYAETNVNGSGLYFGTGNDVRARKSISSSEYNDTYLEVQANKVTSISSSSTDTEYPSAKAVYTNSLENYSTTEQVVGTWIDGKPIYKKTYTFTFPATQTTGEWSTDVTNLNMDKMIKVEGATKSEWGTDHLYFRDLTQVYAYNDTSVAEFGAMYISSGIMRYRYRGFVITEGLITLYYTKTTD